VEPLGLLKCVENVLCHVGVGAPAFQQETAQHEITTALESALEARRQRIIVSHSEINLVKWARLILQAICAFLAIAIVHSDNRLSSRITMGIFATGVAASARGEFASAVSTTRARHAAFSKHEDTAKIQLSSRPGPQSFQSGVPSRHPSRLQAQTLCRIGRVACSCGLIEV
jgi:hypothetical protein